MTYSQARNSIKAWIKLPYMLRATVSVSRALQSLFLDCRTLMLLNDRSHNVSDRAGICVQIYSNSHQRAQSLDHILRTFRCLAGLSLTCFHLWVKLGRKRRHVDMAGWHEKTPIWQSRDLYPWPSSAIFLPEPQFSHLFNGRAGVVLRLL